MALVYHRETQMIFIMCNLTFHHEGCYPNCPPTSPFFDEDNMKCVSIDHCGCYDVQGNHYADGAVVPSQNCYVW